MDDDIYLSSITDFFQENLPDGLKALCLPHVEFPLPPAAFPTFAARLDIPQAKRSYESQSAMFGFFQKLDAGIRANAGGSFVRLGSRSAKDVTWLDQKVHTALDALTVLCKSDRIAADVQWCFLYSYAPVFIVRPWLDISPWREFRCLVRDGKLDGISQYHTLDSPEYSEIAESAARICRDISMFMEELVIPNAGHATFACDVVYGFQKIFVVDVNPLGRSTGLSLFDELYGKPKGPEMRFIHSANVVALPLPKEVPA